MFTFAFSIAESIEAGEMSTPTLASNKSLHVMVNRPDPQYASMRNLGAGGEEGSDFANASLRVFRIYSVNYNVNYQPDNPQR